MAHAGGWMRGGPWAGLTRRGRLGLVYLFFAICHVPFASAQEPPKKEDSGPVMVASFGFGGQAYIGDRWGPITVHITTGDKPVAGAILVRFDQDYTQKAQIEVPFAATPNRTTQVPVVACVPSACGSVRFTMVDDRGRFIQELEYRRAVSERTAQLPPLLESNRGLMVCVGRCSLGDSVRVWNALEGTRTPASYNPNAKRAATRLEVEYGWMQATAARVGPEELPWSWMAYDGVTALVVNPASAGMEGRTAEPRAIEAAHAWVRSGGRLVVMLDGPGETWRAWMPEEAREFVTPDAVLEGPLPDDVSGAVKQAVRTARTKAAESKEEGGAPAEPEITPPGPATTAPHRLLHLSAAGERAGWAMRWAMGSGAGLLAEGPVGYGHVTVLGMDPAKAPATLSARAAGEVWKDALEPAVRDWLGQAALRGRVNVYGHGVDASDRALAMGIERIGDVPAIGDGVFYVIALAVLLLSAMVGPVDYFVLKRLKAGHRSWMTALLWVALSCAAAYAAPRVIRTAPTQLNRVRVVDRMITPGARGGGLTFQSGLTGLYAAQGGTARFKEPDPASWWRGASVNFANEQGSGMAVIPTVQAAAGGAAGSTRGNPLQELPVSMWTFRAMADQSTPEGEWSALSASVRKGADGYRVMVAGVPKGAVVSEATLRVGDQWYGLMRKPVAPEPQKEAQQTFMPRRPPSEQRAPEPAPIKPVGTLEGGAWTALFREGLSAGAPDKVWSGPQDGDAGSNAFYYGWYGSVAVDVRPGPMLELPGAVRRGQSVDRLVASGKFAAVYLNLAGSSDVEVDWPARVGATTVLRVLVPVEGETP